MQTDSEMVNRIWNEYWSDWINIGVAHENDSYVDYEHNNTEVEAQFLSVLHRVFKKSKDTHDTCSPCMFFDIFKYE